MLDFIRNTLYEQYFLSIPDPTASFAHKTVIITGANSGLGREAAKHVARLGCSHLILAVRNVKAGDEARREITATNPATNIEVWEVDLAKFASVRSLVQRAAKLDRLDAVICNAAINTFKYAELEGYESMLTVNVLSTYLMATLMLPVLERTASLGAVQGDPDPRPPHLTIVGSDTHMLASFPERKEPATRMLAAISESCKQSASRYRVQYATTKLLILLLSRDLANSSAARNSPVIINIANPGLCYSNLTNEIAGIARIVYFLLHARPATMGGSALVNAASADASTHGQFLSSNRVHHGSDLSHDLTLAMKLREAVEQALP